MIELTLTPSECEFISPLAKHIQTEAITLGTSSMASLASPPNLSTTVKGMRNILYARLFLFGRLHIAGKVDRTDNRQSTIKMATGKI
ncbi:hypothetical protein C8Q79DRAFT_1008782 [Trametes meyenii]|nr:hypothetical protein C8Q79DRAFT_1008782 [Trametes meyenii]